MIKRYEPYAFTNKDYEVDVEMDDNSDGKWICIDDYMAIESIAKELAEALDAARIFIDSRRLHAYDKYIASDPDKALAKYKALTHD